MSLVTGVLKYKEKEYLVGLMCEERYQRVLVLNYYTKADEERLLYGVEPKDIILNKFLINKYTPQHIKEFSVKKKLKAELLVLPETTNTITLKLYEVLDKVIDMGTRGKNAKVRPVTFSDTHVVDVIEGENEEFSAKLKRIGKDVIEFKYKDADLEIDLITGAKINMKPYSMDKLVVANRELEDLSYSQDVKQITYELVTKGVDMSGFSRKFYTMIDSNKKFLTLVWDKIILGVKNNLLKKQLDAKEQDIRKKLLTVDKNDVEYKKLNSLLNGVIKAKERVASKIAVALDYETSGFKVYNLPKDSPLLDTPTSLQLSWEDDQGVLINLNMKNFNNCDPDFVHKYLGILFREYLPDKSLRTKEDMILDAFKKKNHVKPKLRRSSKFKVRTSTGEEVIMCRNDVCLIGHNAIFDSMVSIFYAGYENQFFFDQDTQQMTFNLDPVGTRGKKGLKETTYRLHGVKQFSLEDVLGKGNEGRFGDLADRDVALLYGCADSDFTRLNFFRILPLMEDIMYKSYKGLHVYMWYILARATYNGMRIDEAKLKRLKESAEGNLSRIENFIYEYVGTMIERNNILRKLKILAPKQNIPEEEIPIVCSKLLNRTIEKQGTLLYKFKLTGNDMLDVLYKKLGYLEFRNEEGRLINNKFSRKRLQTFKNAVPSGFMKDHLYAVEYDKNNPDHHDKNGSVLKDYILINKDEFNGLKYPLASVLDIYAARMKEYTAYLVPYTNDDYSGYIYSSFSTTNIETYRISNKIQTTSKAMKDIFIGWDKDYYAMNWDKRQIEARLTAAEAGDYMMVHSLNNDEKDFHTENGARVFGVEPHLLADSDRSKGKSVNFGLLYGLGLVKLCENLFGKPTPLNRSKTQDTINTYKEANKLSCEYLENFRAHALVEWEPGEDFRKLLGYEGRKLSRVLNKNGFYRVFDLTDKTENYQLASVQRAAGNFPIQSYAKDIFCYSIMRFFVKLGELDLREKVLIHMLVHDEIQCSVHKSLDPRFIMKLVYENCQPAIRVNEPAEAPDFEIPKDAYYMNYYVGLSFGDSWYECKKGYCEMPTKLLTRTVAKVNRGLIEFRPWTDDPKSVVSPMIEEFYKERITEVIKEIQPNIMSEPTDFELISEKMTNYTVRGYLSDEYKNCVKLPKMTDKGEFLNTYNALLGWTLNEKGEDSEILYKGMTIKAGKFKESGILEKEAEFFKPTDKEKRQKEEIENNMSKLEEVLLDDEGDGEEMLNILAISKYDGEVEDTEVIDEFANLITRVTSTDSTMMVITTGQGMRNLVSSDELKYTSGKFKKMFVNVNGSIVRQQKIPANITENMIKKVANV